MGASWHQFAEDAPELAETVKRRFAANLHHVVGTIRPDGSPRLSGSEVDIDAVSLVEVDGDELVLTVWTPRDGLKQIRRR